ncbi:MAG: hypothetical protein NVSMB31_09060 [Vulcanimicrobiaceae bacterium]
MKIKLGSVALAAMFGLIVPIVASAATLSLPTGSEMSVTIDQTLDSHSAQAGDRFTAHVVPPYPFGNQALSGAVVTGEIISVQHAGQGTKPAIAIKFDSIRLRDGSSAPMDADVTQAQPKEQMKDGARVAEYTIGGLLVGNAIAKTVFHAKGGGIAGAAGGFLLGNNYKADIQFPQGSAMTVKMNHTLSIRRQPQKRH